MYSQKIRLLSLNLILVMLLTLMPVQAVEDTGTGPDEDKKTEYTVELNGSGGALNGEEKVVVTYSAEKPLNLREYPFAREGYVLAGWSEDATGTAIAFGCDNFLSWQIGGVLYAVWLKVPESGNYAIFDTCGWGELPDAFSRVGTLCCVKLTDDFKMPVLKKATQSQGRRSGSGAAQAIGAQFTTRGKHSSPKAGCSSALSLFGTGTDITR